MLERLTHADLANLYNHDMEVQVNVAQDDGTRVDREYRGRKLHCWTDGVTEWKSFRIPLKANSDPEYQDSAMKWDLAAHAEAIGLTGWDWKNKVSRWVAYDFDSILGHEKAGLTDEQLRAVQDAASAVDWVTIRKSTSGRGLHLYVHLVPVPTSTHTEHAALARAILGRLAALTGYDFKSKVDVCGGVMWVWARKMRGTDGLELIKQGTILTEEPPNWRDHVAVVKGTRRRNLPQEIKDVDAFEQLVGQNPRIELDDEHKRFIQWLKEEDKFWYWDQDNHLLVTHTAHVKEAHEALQMRGIFDTLTPATDKEHQNCFCAPMRKGAWSVRRFGQGVQEHASWEQDASGWTRCYINRVPDLKAASRAMGGVEDPKGGFVFREADLAVRAASMMGVEIKIEPRMVARPAKLLPHKDGRLVIEVESAESDASVEGWLKKKDTWTQVLNMPFAANPEQDFTALDEVIRSIITPTNDDAGWLVKTEKGWINQTMANAKMMLKSMGYSDKELNYIMGGAVTKPWRIVSVPFAEEYPGDREWNQNSAQLRYKPSDGEERKIPTWQALLTQAGKGLDAAVASHPWCKEHGLTTGSDYLKCWLASLIKEPLQPLPYLFFWSKEQNTGKTTFNESLNILFSRGRQKADAALTSQAGFNAELQGAIVCVVEEINLGQNATAYNRIKDWVTAKEICIHPKGGTPYHVPNTTHWIQTANDYSYCPIFPGDTRITVIHVPPLDPISAMPRKVFDTRLEQEAADFLAELLALELPPPCDRLNIPVIDTEDKQITAQINANMLERFCEENIIPAPGYSIKFGELYDRFQEYAGVEHQKWSRIRVTREITYLKGKSRKDAQIHLANVGWRGQCDTPMTFHYEVSDNMLVEVPI
jgi:hypothetical protein